jgi:acetylornithine deacetylase/succinyl-diaminopimelate desuccinylase-like protein
MTILELTKKLIALPSVSTDQIECKAVFDCIVEVFSKTKEIFIDREEKNGVHSLIIKNFDGQYADICFNGHIDVVPPQSEDQRIPVERE